MIADEVQYKATKRHLQQFRQAERNLEAQLPESPSRLESLELAAVRAVAEDLEADLEAYRQLHE